VAPPRWDAPDDPLPAANRAVEVHGTTITNGGVPSAPVPGGVLRPTQETMLYMNIKQEIKPTILISAAALVVVVLGIISWKIMAPKASDALPENRIGPQGRLAPLPANMPPPGKPYNGPKPPPGAGAMLPGAGPMPPGAGPMPPPGTR
jgi:hypothetical protein